MERTNTQTTFPWYKERLQTKYLKDPKNKLSLDSSCWHFLDMGLNDFRDGCPNPARGILSGAKRGVSPVIFHDTTRHCNRVPRKRFSKQQTCFSKQMVQKQIRREHVAAVEEKLLQHPLALYPYYKKCMTPELFDKVISVLDPDMCVNSASAAPMPAAEHMEEENEEKYTEPNKEEVEEVNRAEHGTPANEINPEIQKSSPKNPYIGLKINENTAKEDKRANERRLSSPFQDEDIEKVTMLFSDWFTSLGEETNNIMESTIPGHFVSGIEETLALTPIQVGKVDNLPDERCNTITTSSRQDTDVLKDSESNKRKPGTKKPVYGAWYLHPKTRGKKSNVDETLQDPSDTPKELEFQLQTSKKDEELKQMHVTQAFRQYIINKGLRMPRFLGNLFSEEEQGTQKTGAFGSASARKGNMAN